MENDRYAELTFFEKDSSKDRYSFGEFDSKKGARVYMNIPLGCDPDSLDSAVCVGDSPFDTGIYARGVVA